MEGGFCNIQVLLRAAEFLERRERGKYFVASAFSKGEEVGYCWKNKMHCERGSGKKLESGVQGNELLPRLSPLW